MTERPLLYVRFRQDGTREVYRDGKPTGDVIEQGGVFPMFYVLGVPGEFFRIHEALDALEQQMEAPDAGLVGEQ